MLYVCVRGVMDVVIFCLYCDSWSCMCVSCVHPVAVLNAAWVAVC